MKIHQRSSCWRLIAGFALGAAFFFFSFRAADDLFNISRNLDIMTSIYREIHMNYVDKVNADDLMEKSIDGMLTTLDPYTEFIPESELEEFKLNYVNTEYGGIGAMIMPRHGGMSISEVYEGFPAWKSGLRAGDEILKIDGVPVAGKDAEQVSDLLKGRQHTRLEMLLKRPGEKKLLQKTIEREKVRFPNVSYAGALEGKAGYIKLDKFLEDASDEVKEAFLELKKDDHIQSLILDLRGNGGGILQEAVKLVSFFVESGDTVVTQRGREGEQVIAYRSKGRPLDLQIPLVVLVDQHTASASEIVAGAFQDFDRAIIIGQRTFGKGLVQQTLRMPYNSLLKMTIGKYYTPSGRCIQALDYAHRNLDGSASRVADSTIAEYQTLNGRLVYDGSGIYPDLLITRTQPSAVTRSIMNNLLHFDYATDFREQHKRIPSVNSFTIDDHIYQDFVSWLDEKGFDYRSKSEELMGHLREITRRERRFNDVKTEYQALLNKLEHNKSEDLRTFRPEISELLENEIVSRYYFQKGRIQSALKYDRDIEKALDVLNEPQLYASILEGAGSYKTIGKPVSVMARRKPNERKALRSVEDAEALPD